VFTSIPVVSFMYCWSKSSSSWFSVLISSDILLNELPKASLACVNLSAAATASNCVSTYFVNDATNDGRLKEDEIRNAETARQSKINEELFQLDLKLKTELRAAQQKYDQDRIKAEVSTAENIMQSVESETAFRLRQIDLEREEERKRFALKGEKLPDNIENDFSEKATKVKQEQQLKQLTLLRSYYQQQLQLYVGFQNEMLQAELKAQQSDLSLASPLNTAAGLDKRTSIIDKQLQIQLAANAAKYDVEVRDLERMQSERRAKGLEETEDYQNTQLVLAGIYKEFADNEELAIRDANIKKLTAHADYYQQFIQLVKDNEASAALAIALNASKEGAEIRKGRPNFLSRADQLRVSSLDADTATNKSNIVQDTEALAKAQERLNAANEKAKQIAESGSTELMGIAIKEQQNAQDEVNQLEKKIIDSENKNLDNRREIRKIYFNEAIKQYKALSDAAVQAYTVIAEARQRDLDREIQVRTQRVTMALKLAERGNTLALAQEQKALEEANRQRRNAALQQQQINAALTLSNALVAVAKAAAEGGVAAPATIALALVALGVGFAQATALSNSQRNTGYYKGGYTGDGGKYDEAGTVHKGEFVFTKETTSKHRELFEAIHKGYDPMPTMGMPKYTTTNTGFATKKEFAMLGDKLDTLIAKEVNVSQVVDKTGVHQIVVEQQSAHRVKWAD